MCGAGKVAGTGCVIADGVEFGAQLYKAGSNRACDGDGFRTGGRSSFGNRKTLFWVRRFQSLVTVRLMPCKRFGDTFKSSAGKRECDRPMTGLASIVGGASVAVVVTGCCAKTGVATDCCVAFGADDCSSLSLLRNRSFSIAW